MKSLKKTAVPIKYMLLLAYVTIFIFPLFWSVLSSFKGPRDIIAITPKFLFTPTADNYSMLFQSGEIPFMKYFINSVIISVTSTILSVCLASLSGYSLARLRPSGHKAVSILILVARMIPPIVIIIPLYLFYGKLGLLDTLIGLILPYTALNIPLATILLSSFFEGLPPQLEEAATVDGCGVWRCFWNIMLPLTAPGLVATTIFSFELAWNDYIFALPLTSTKALPLTVVASMVRTEEGVLWGKLGAIITILIIPVTLMTLFAQKYLISGLVAGSVKE